MSPEIHDDVLDRALSEKSATRPPLQASLRPSRNEHFVTGAMAARDPRSLHPNMTDYHGEQGWGEGPNDSVVGYVPTHVLAGMHGNPTDRQGIERHKARLLSGEGFTDPVMVEFDHRNKRMVVGEGNHRVDAAMELGISHVPVRVRRSSISDDEMEYMHRKGGNPVDIDPGSSPYESRAHGEDASTYWPPDIHPKHLFHDVL